MNKKDKNEQNSIFNKANAFRALLGAITIGSFAKTANTINNGIDPLEIPIEISEDTYRNIIRLNENFPDSKIIYTMDDGRDGNLVNLLETQFVDRSINRKNLALVKRMSIDAKSFNFNDLLLLPNLEEIEILNYDSLTDSDKNAINELSNLKKIKLFLNVEYMKVADGFDLSWINDSVDIYFERLLLNGNDLNDLYIYKLYADLDEDVRKRVKLELFDDVRVKKLEVWNKEMEKIIESFNFNEVTTDEEKIIKILSFVTDKIEYNPKVSAELSNDVSVMADNEVDNLIKNYNEHLLETVLDNEDGYGICCNYAALSSILGHYSDLVLPYICGMYNDGGHAWCSYVNDGKDSIIDPTFLDSDEIFNVQKMNLDLIENSGASHRDEDLYKKYMLEQIFTTSEEKNYSFYKPLDSYENVSISSNNKIDKSSRKINEDISVYEQYFSKSILYDSFLGWVSILLLYANVAVSKSKKEREMIKRKYTY